MLFWKYVFYFFICLALEQFHFAYVLLLVAVVASYDALVFVNHGENGLHRLVVRDAFGVVAFYDAVEFVGSFHLFLFHNLVVLDYVKHRVWGDNRQAGYFLVGEEFVFHFDNALSPYLF